jgi:hypothetical protein
LDLVSAAFVKYSDIFGCNNLRRDTQNRQMSMCKPINNGLLMCKKFRRVQRWSAETQEQTTVPCTAEFNIRQTLIYISVNSPWLKETGKCLQSDVACLKHKAAIFTEYRTSPAYIDSLAVEWIWQCPTFAIIDSDGLALKEA